MRPLFLPAADALAAMTVDSALNEGAMNEAGLHREKKAGRFLASVSIAGCPGKTSGNGILIPLKFASVSDADGASLKATVCVAERGEWSEPVHDLAVRSTRSGTGMNCQAQTAGGSCSPARRLQRRSPPESARFAPTDRLRTGSKLPMRQKTPMPAHSSARWCF